MLGNFKGPNLTVPIKWNPTCIADLDRSFEDELFELYIFAKKVTLPLALSMKEPRRVDVNGSFRNRPFRNN